MNKFPHSWVLAALLSAAVTASVVASWQSRFGDVGEFFLGNIGLLPFVVAAVTVAFLAWNARTATLGLRNTEAALQQSRLAEVATRFQKGMEMLSNENEATRIGGLYILRDVALANPEAYWESITDSVVPFIVSRCSAAKERYWNAVEYVEEKGGQIPEEATTDKTPFDVIVALKLVCKADDRLRDAIASVAARRIEIEGLVLAHVDLIGLDLSGATLLNPVFEDVTFHDCRARGLIVEDMRCGGVSFIGCGLEGAFIGSSHMVFAHHRLDFYECDLTSANVHARPRAGGRIETCYVEQLILNAPKIEIADCSYTNEPAVRGDNTELTDEQFVAGDALWYATRPLAFTVYSTMEKAPTPDFRRR